MKKIKFVYFDVAGTLLHKPLLYEKIGQAFHEHALSLPPAYIKKFHRRLSEISTFPDKTSKEFYDLFNRNLMLLLGIIPGKEIADTIYKNCVDLKWGKYEDTGILEKIKYPLGIISNWDETLEQELSSNFDIPFKVILISGKEKIRKPAKRIFSLACRAAGHAAEEILYIGDSIKLDIEPAKLIGMQTILIDRDDDYPYYNGKKIKSLHELLKGSGAPHAWGSV